MMLHVGAECVRKLNYLRMFEGGKSINCEIWIDLWKFTLLQHSADTELKIVINETQFLASSFTAKRIIIEIESMTDSICRIESKRDTNYFLSLHFHSLITRECFAHN